MLRRFWVIVALLGVVASGCSSPQAPDGQGSGTVTFRLIRSDASMYAAEGMQALAAALPPTDSIHVDVYPPTGTTPEVSVGYGVPLAADTMQVQLSVIAQQNKRVSVRLFGGGSLLYWGVDTDVDVVANASTRVVIQANAYAMGTLWFAPSRVWDNEPFSMLWNRVDGANGYRVQVSPSPSFAVISWDSVVTDTFVSGPVPAGDYYFRVRARNTYVSSDWRTANLHVGGAPFVSGISTVEVIRGATADVDVFGSDLDHTSTTVTIFGQTATIVSSSPTQLAVRVQVPAGALSDVVTVSNDFGADASGALVKVQSIAYLMGPVTGGDWTSANTYKSFIESYGDYIDQGAVAIIPYDLASVISDWSVFDVVIIGADTGVDEPTWAGGGGDATTLATAIDAGRAAVLGIGRGGAAFFQILGRDIGLKNCQSNFQSTAVVMNATSPVYTWPNDLGLSDAQTITIHSSAARLLSANLSLVPAPPGVSFHARRSLVETLFPLVEQQAGSGGGSGLGFLWGFEASPTTLTAVGAAVFANTINYLYGGPKRALPQ